MMKKDELLAMRAIALCFKPYLKPEEALIYCNLGRTQFSKKCEEFGVYKSNTGYYKRADLDRMMEGAHDCANGARSANSGAILRMRPLGKKRA